MVRTVLGSMSNILAITFFGVPRPASSTTAPCLSRLIISLSGKPCCRRVSITSASCSIALPPLRDQGGKIQMPQGWIFTLPLTPPIRPLPDEALRMLDALLTRRRQLIEMLVAERNRLAHALPPVEKSLKQHIRWLERRLADVDSDMDQAIQQSPVWRAKEDLLRSVPGVGPVVSRTLLADLPELGALNRVNGNRKRALCGN